MLKVYDLHFDDYREPTQADIDALEAVAQAYTQLRIAVETAHVGLQARLDVIRSQYGLPVRAGK